MNNQAVAATDQDAIRQAQHEWRLAKRREMETKARKKQFNKRRNSYVALPQHQHPSALHPHIQPPHVHTSAIYAAASMPLPPPSVSHPHPISIQPGVVFPHPDNVTSAQMPIHPPVSVSAPHHVHQSHPQMHHTAIAPAPTMDPAAPIQLQQHTNANAKRTHGALQDGTNEHDPDVAVAARAAAVHAAASAAPGDAQFAQSFANVMAQQGASVPASDSNRADDITNEAQGLAQSEAARRLSEQREAQRQWREAKRREIAAKKAKSPSSKRGRKKARTTPLVHPVSSGLVAQPMSAHHSTQMHIGVSPGYMRDATAQAAVVASAQQGPMPEEHQTAMYDDGQTVQNVEQMLQQSVDDGVLAPTSRPMGSFARPVTSSTIAKAKNDETSVVTTELLAATTEAALNAVPDLKTKKQNENESGDITKAAEDQSGTAVETKPGEEESSAPRAGSDGHDTNKTSPKTEIDIEKRASEGAELPGSEGPTHSGAEVKSGASAKAMGHAAENKLEAKEQVGEGERRASTQANEVLTDDATEQAGAGVAVQQTDEVSGENEVQKEEKKGFETESVFRAPPDTSALSGKEMVNLGPVSQGQSEGNQLPVAQDNEGELKDDPQEGLDVDGGDGGEDIMTAAAWQSLDSISHT